MKKLLIEGWRGINQSFAMVNQYQLMELARHPALQLSHEDLPFFSRKWNTQDNNPQFPPEMEAAIRAVPTAEPGAHVDTVLRIASPFARSQANADRVLTFMTGEYGLRPDSFAPGQGAVEAFVSGSDAMVVPSRWSRMKLAEWGFPQDKVAIVPHGVHPDIFFPMPAAEREGLRRAIGLAPDDFVFLNLGAMSMNKGIDVLLPAFCAIRQRHPRARLVLKDDQKLYGLSGQDVVREILQHQPGLLTEELLSSVKFLSVTLPLYEMRHLYCMADVFVSPYRAEGFNLPVIEAIACGTPAIVTAGGATDDFCEARTSAPVASSQVDNQSKGIPGTGYHLEPSLDSLIEAMDLAVRSPKGGSADFEAGRQHLLAHFSWAACVRQLAALC